MACSSCGQNRPATPYIQTGMPTVWAWLTPSPDLIPVDPAEAEVVMDVLYGEVI